MASTLKRSRPTWVVGVVDGSADAEFHILCGEFVDDVFGVAEGACQPVEFGDDQGVTAAASGECLAQSRACTVGAGEAVIGVDQGWSDSESFEGILLSGQVLFVCGYACVADRQFIHERRVIAVHELLKDRVDRGPACGQFSEDPPPDSASISSRPSMVIQPSGGVSLVLSMNRP